MKIYKLGEDVLRQKCTPVDKAQINDEFRQLLAEMFQAMKKAGGVGLAAPQVGITQRFFVAVADDDVKRVFVNPEITWTSPEVGEFDEGCLSLPGLSENIVRPVRVSVRALDENGKPFFLEDVGGLLARIIQHENDHLDGILYIDRGTQEFKAKAQEHFRKKAEKERKKAAQKEAKRQSTDAKIAAKIASKAAAKAAAKKDS